MQARRALLAAEGFRVKPVSAEASQVIDAPPAKVWRILTDYRVHHPNILPKPAFESIAVEEGGVGAGTVVRVGMKVMGARSTLRLAVTEPEPGRVLREADPAAGVVTTFTVTPVDGGARSDVRIATEWAPKKGAQGFVERLVNPPVARSLYKKELRLLDAYARGVQ
jgi:uncharacterized protein YndB with AHSA1/START domain